MNREVENGRITRCEVEMNRGFVLGLELLVEGDGWGQGFGGYMLAHADRSASPGSALLAMAVARLFKVFDIDKVSSAKGQPCRVRRKDGRIEAVGHFFKDRWLSFEDVVEDARAHGLLPTEEAP